MTRNGYRPVCRQGLDCVRTMVIRMRDAPSNEG
jgi:hypothetical protein